ncbi:MAG TPA: ABC transporter ATP-binding protein [Iamia sp.]|nr:ABC transporter ATP-binding protein [Iamia sp.]
MPADEPLLRTDGLTVDYGGVRAIDQVDIEVDAGEIVGLIGPNGAGKTTFVDAVTGFAPSTGRVSFDRSDVSRVGAHRRARRGLARTWQSLELFSDLSVHENALVAARRMSWRSVLADLVCPVRARAVDGARAALEAVGIEALGERLPRELSLGQQKLVGVARALASAPKVILLDEPAAGLDTTESQELGRQLRSIANDGVGLLLIDHDMELVLQVCDRLYVMDVGRIIASGPPALIRTDRAVIAAYLGDTTELGVPTATTEGTASCG